MARLNIFPINWKESQHNDFYPQITQQQLQEQIAREQQLNQQLLLQQEIQRLKYEQELKEQEKRHRPPSLSTVDDLPQTGRKDPDEEFSSPRRRIRPIERRNFRCFCISCPPCIWIPCSLLWTAILILSIILGSITYSNMKQCKNLNVDNFSPSIMTYDPNIFNEVIIDKSGGYLEGQVWVAQDDSKTSKNATVRIQVASISEQGATVQTSFSDSQYSINLSQSGYNSPFEFFGYWTLPPKCSKARVQIIVPQSSSNKTATTTITSNNIDVTLQQNAVPFYDKIFNITTIESNIIVENFTANSIILTSRLGKISGSIGGIYSQLKASTVESDIQLSANLVSNLDSFASYLKVQQQPTIDVETIDGAVDLKFNSTFSGNYSVTTNKGTIQPINTQNITNSDNSQTQVSGIISGNLNANLTITTYNGNINLEF
ncbi:5048_t:CDS:2 [Ambispora leptoticha]|uniref:5048_t:CDS:1 n=1 Tax=Ambispora leptoticha TaxID=144679 RepID=A0A9N9EWX9_9GLOM|nr:5048_t:CDS:2 [Ambispora leptoticha]